MLDKLFSGLGIAVRKKTEPPIPGEPFMSIAAAKAIAGPLVSALDEIANPIAAMKKRAKASGDQIDGMMANYLANDAEYLKGIARKALSDVTNTSETDAHARGTSTHQ